jgi:hypothetical protein
MEATIEQKLKNLYEQKSVLENTYQRVLGAIELAEGLMKKDDKPDDKPAPSKAKK